MRTAERPATERALQLAVASTQRSALACCCPNYTPAGWFECDVWGVTHAGYVVEFEVKLTLSDYRADRAKSVRAFEYAENGAFLGIADRNKHAMLGARDSRGPSRFFYVVPESIAQSVRAELPDWAGLLVYRGRWRLAEEVNAPRLHRQKVKPREIVLAQRRMWYRYWQALQHLESRGIAFDEGTPAGNGPGET